MTDVGVCCAFNQQLALNENSIYSRLLQELQVVTLQCCWYKLSPKQGGAGSMQKDNGMVRPGKEKGLQIVLDRNFDR